MSKRQNRKAGSGILKRTRWRSGDQVSFNTSATNTSFCSSSDADESDSPDVELQLIDKLEQVRGKLDMNEGNVELSGLSKDSQSAKDYIQLRDKLRSEVPDPIQFDSKTDLNLGSATIAGAKVLVDESRTTRSMSKKLVEQCGINEDDFLYKGLRRGQTDLKCAQEIAQMRKSAVIESLVDFQKQIDFKGKILKHVASHTIYAESKSDSRIYRPKRGKNCKALDMCSMKTPNSIKRTSELNPLDDKKILDSYAVQIAEEASGLSRRRSIGTVPFNRALLDDENWS